MIKYQSYVRKFYGTICHMEERTGNTIAHLCSVAVSPTSQPGPGFQRSFPSLLQRDSKRWMHGDKGQSLLTASLFVPEYPKLTIPLWRHARKLAVGAGLYLVADLRRANALNSASVQSAAPRRGARCSRELADQSPSVVGPARSPRYVAIR